MSLLLKKSFKSIVSSVSFFNLLQRISNRTFCLKIYEILLPLKI